MNYKNIEEKFAENLSARNAQQYGQGPFIGYVADAQTPWIDLYTSKTGTYVGRIPYEIFNLWPATDRDSEWWTPGWEPEYMKYYYAEFGAFCWAAVHLGDTVLGSGRKNIATSADGGKTWNCGSYMDDYGGNHVVGMYFVSDKIAFMSFDPNNVHELIDGPEISRTIDGGKTWKRLVVSVPDSLKGKKLLAGTPIHEGDVIRYPIRHNPAHGSFEGETMYIISRDNGMTWEWEDTQTVNTVTLTTYSLIPRNTTGSIVSLTLPSAWQWDGSNFNEANVRIGVYSDQKRAVVYGALPTLQEFEDTLRESTERVYQMDSPITGRTAAGYAYTGYYGDEEMPKGEMSRLYMFYIATDHGAYRLEVWQRLDFDGKNFFEDTVLPIVQSFAIQQTLPHQAIMENQSFL